MHSKIYLETVLIYYTKTIIILILKFLILWNLLTIYNPILTRIPNPNIIFQILQEWILIFISISIITTL
jgi:hypothetical protein